MIIDDPLFTVRESATALRISVATFYRRVADGTLPKPIRIGSMVRWSKSDLEAAVRAAKTYSR